MHSEGTSPRYIPHMSAKDSDTEKKYKYTNVYFMLTQNVLLNAFALWQKGKMSRSHSPQNNQKKEKDDTLWRLF